MSGQLFEPGTQDCAHPGVASGLTTSAEYQKCFGDPG